MSMCGPIPPFVPVPYQPHLRWMLHSPGASTDTHLGDSIQAYCAPFKGKTRCEFNTMGALSGESGFESKSECGGLKAGCPAASPPHPPLRQAESSGQWAIPR